MGLDPRRIPIVAHAFDRFRYPLASTAPDDIVVHHAGGTLTWRAAHRAVGAAFMPPRGWRGFCELAPET
jgi:hypothetical protein